MWLVGNDIMCRGRKIPMTPISCGKIKETNPSTHKRQGVEKSEQMEEKNAFTRKERSAYKNGATSNLDIRNVLFPAAQNPL